MRKRAKFNLSNFHNCTLKMGQLYPVHLQEVLPGDTIQMNQSIFMRLAPMVAPVMHPVYMFCHTFYVPSRVISNWMSKFWPSSEEPFSFESFITGGDDGNYSSTIPQCQVGSGSSGGLDFGLADAFGLPIQQISKSAYFDVSVFPFYAYYMIWNNYYRDQDLQLEFVPKLTTAPGAPRVWYLEKSDGTEIPGFPLLQPCWSKDYFTTARPWPQKGPQVTIPVQAAGGITGNVTLTASGSPTFTFTDGTSAVPPQGPYPIYLDADESGAAGTTVTGGLKVSHGNGSGGGTDYAALSWANPGLAASFTSTTPSGIGSIDITDFREAMALQRFEEHRSLYGSRYEDYLRYLGVRPQDARLQMPEYLGGFTSPVQFSEVLQTSPNPETGGVGNLYGHGISAARGRRIRRFIPEHGYIMSLMCVRPIPVYAQGIERLWSKKTKEDFWQRELEHIGQQEVLNSEVYADGTASDATTFGYQNRYDEYRRGVNVITGEFRGNQDFWTMARIFDKRPALNADFVECNPTDRIFQVDAKNSDQLYCMVKNNVIAKRLVSKNGNPI